MSVLLRLHTGFTGSAVPYWGTSVTAVIGIAPGLGWLLGILQYPGFGGEGTVTFLQLLLGIL